MQITNSDTAQRMVALVLAYGPLPRVNVDGEKIAKRLLSDKKTVGGVPHFILASGIGKVEVVDTVSTKAVMDAVEEIKELSKAKS